jgi:hypothetical protein
MSLERTKSPDAPQRRAMPGRTLRAGALSLTLSLVLVFLPLLWGESDLNKYVVVIGFLGANLALSLLLHGAWDWVRARRRRRRN